VKRMQLHDMKRFGFRLVWWTAYDNIITILTFQKYKEWHIRSAAIAVGFSMSEFALPLNFMFTHHYSYYYKDDYSISLLWFYVIIRLRDKES
jgi:hypothetical protein